jgi:dethiobiotin synthetase
MQVFIAGTDTNIGKTLISSWLCLHTGYAYFKPIQTGMSEGNDSSLVSTLAGATIYPEKYLYKAPLSPHLAAKLENKNIDINNIKLPEAQNLIVEGAGGLLVPLTQDYLMIDLIKLLAIPVILVASSRLGTINHTLLSLEALRLRDISILGVIVSGKTNQSNCDAIEFYGNIKIIAQIPFLSQFTRNTLSQIPLSQDLMQILGI